jgi:hypothetical protein
MMHCFEYLRKFVSIRSKSDISFYSAATTRQPELNDLKPSTCAAELKMNDRLRHYFAASV